VKPLEVFFLTPVNMSLPTSAPRLHRLPHKTDFVLIPAPLDLSLSEATEKSTLPAIIVTPCSPSSSRDFSIAFLADPPKPSLRQCIVSWKHYGGPRIRSILIVLFIIFGLIFHLAVDRFTAQRPYMEMVTQSGNDAPVRDSSIGWINFQSLFSDDVVFVHPDFITNESIGLR